MVEQVSALKLLGVASALALADRQIARAGACDDLLKRSQDFAQAAQDESVRRADFRQRGMELIAQDETEAQAAVPQQHGAAAAGAAQDGDAVCPASHFVHVLPAAVNACCAPIVPTPG